MLYIVLIVLIILNFLVISVMPVVILRFNYNHYPYDKDVNKKVSEIIKGLKRKEITVISKQDNTCKLSNGDVINFNTSYDNIDFLSINGIRKSPSFINSILVMKHLRKAFDDINSTML